MPGNLRNQFFLDGGLDVSPFSNGRLPHSGWEGFQLYVADHLDPKVSISSGHLFAYIIVKQYYLETLAFDTVLLGNTCLTSDRDAYLL